MLNKLLPATFISTAVFLTACQSTPTAPVIARADNTFETIGLGANKVQAQNSALANAKKSCGFAQPIIIKDTLIYHGVFDEKLGRMAEQGINVLGSVFGSDTPKLSRDDDYEYQISFKCQ